MTNLETELNVITRGRSGPRVGAFFDLDGTLIDGYSAMAFYQDRARRLQLGPMEAAQTLLTGLRGIETEQQFREAAARGVRAWRGRSMDEMEELSDRLFRGAIAKTFFHDAWRLVKAHQHRGHTVAIASSASHFQVAPLARELGVRHLLCTPLEERDGILTGRIGDPVPWGRGKAKAVRAFAAQHRIDLRASYAYANGDEDVPFLKAVGKSRAVNPESKLATVAEEFDWPVLRFASRGWPGLLPTIRTGTVVATMAGAMGAGIGAGLLNRNRRHAIDLAVSLAGDLGLAAADVDVNVQGEEHLWSHRPAVFIINHQSSLVDLLVSCKLLRHGFTAVGKKEAASAPFFGTFFRMIDVAFVDRGNPAHNKKVLAPVVEKVQSGISVLIAPEGTRSYTPELRPFKKGPFHIALQAGVPIVPIVIRNAGEILWRNSRIMRPGTVDVVVHPPIFVDDWTVEDLDERVADVRQLFVDTLASWPGPPRRSTPQRRRAAASRDGSSRVPANTSRK